MTDRRQLEWLWFSAVLGAGAAHCGQVLALYGSPGELYDAVGSEDMSGLLTPAQLRRCETLTPQRFEPLLARCERMGIRVLCLDEEDYPARLAPLSDAPPVLFCTGDVSALSQPAAVAMIGSRRPSSYGVEAAALIGSQLAQAGVCLVSGLADGLDSEAHKAAVAAGAPTVGVLGTAIDKTYPAINRRLRSEMEQGCGAVISEFAPGEATGAGGFLLRNRLIAALSDAVCVVEARQKSGTMNTVNHAKRYGRTVFAVPGAIFSPLCGGTNQLLDEGQAHAASSAAPILRHLGIEPAPHIACRRERPATPKLNLSAEAKAMKKALTSQAQGLEPLAKAAGLSAGQALAALMELEVSGIAVSGAGGQYRRA